MEFATHRNHCEVLPQTVAITGASGAVGRQVCLGLRAAGFNVRAIGRSPVGLDIADESVVAPLDDTRALATAMNGAAAVIHLAALLHINNPGSDIKEKYWQVNVAGSRHVCEAASECGVKRVILASTINVYGSAFQQGVVNESTAPCPIDWYSESKLAAEEVGLTFPNVTIWRLAAVLGRGLKGNYRTLLKLARYGVLPCIGDGSNRRTLIHAADLSRLMAADLRADPSTQRLWNVCDSTIYSLNEILASIREATGGRTKILHIPRHVTQGGLGMVEALFRAMRLKAPVGRWLVDKMCEDVAVDGSALWQELGMAPAVSLVDGWRDAAGELNLIETLESARHCQRAA
ncbi:NAD-dependent epimerase/dehydratase family protein [Planctopirus hydrillae]|uniref:NAD-dependent epimerase/dehydratase domain-containing protein n=1 Tax=Planctopirus hydrillae TaxID=1841610 RepID=A0A1C3E8K8_9PLAN|nr:NAD-dependent epimerase/dehydratase family protein [Planctopirus hydrillae]ODA29564.1 hypothetical protein A6X21_07750 [Planctopirus hydrillae]